MAFKTIKLLSNLNASGLNISDGDMFVFKKKDGATYSITYSLLLQKLKESL